MPRQEQAEEISDGEFLQAETYSGRPVVAVFFEVLYVTQKPAASVDDRIICRRQLLWLHFKGVGAGESVANTELNSEIVSPCVGAPVGFVE